MNYFLMMDIIWEKYMDEYHWKYDHHLKTIRYTIQNIRDNIEL